MIRRHEKDRNVEIKLNLKEENAQKISGKEKYLKNFYFRKT